jgi:hypothetical protein
MQVVDANGNMYGDDNLEINDINGKPKTTGGGGAVGYYAQYQDDISQPLGAVNVGQPVKFRTMDYSNGVSVVSDTEITIANTGIYNLQFSFQFQNVDNQEQDVTIWLRKNGADVTGSAGFVAVVASHGGVPGHCLPSWNYLLDAVGGDFYELYWSATSLDVSLHFYPAVSPPPSAASAIFTVTQQAGIIAGTGMTALNGLSADIQTISTGTTGTDFNVVSSGIDHEFNMPTASATNRGALSTTDWTTFNTKQDALVSGTNIKTINSTSLLGSGDIAISSSPYTTVGNSAGVLVNGTTSNTISASILIPGSTLVATKVLQLRAQVRKISGTGTSNIRFYFNTTNSLVGATQIGQAQNMTGAGQMQRVARDFYIDTTSLLCYLPTNPIATDLSSGAVSSILYTLANPYYLIAAVQNSTLTELAIVTRLNLMTY